MQFLTQQTYSDTISRKIMFLKSCQGVELTRSLPTTSIPEGVFQNQGISVHFEGQRVSAFESTLNFTST